MQHCWEVGPLERWSGHEGSTLTNRLIHLLWGRICNYRSGFVIKGQVQSVFLPRLLPSLCPSTMGCNSKKTLVRCDPSIWDFPASRTVNQYISVHYKLPKLWYSVIRAHSGLRHRHGLMHFVALFSRTSTTSGMCTFQPLQPISLMVLLFTHRCPEGQVSWCLIWTFFSFYLFI